jgi:putative Mg2+ transporter-C (MgtC) family protein
MPLHPTWDDIALRLLLTMIAGAAIGFNRGVRGHTAGLRTTILVGLAASVAMIQANILLPVAGKTVESFAVMDLMRLPLGILTGVGFIGGGAILKRGDLVTGVTTAATLWVVTVIGLCLGGGQIGLGASATILGMITLWALKWIDLRMPRKHRATLVIRGEPGRLLVPELTELVEPLKYGIQFRGQAQDEAGSPIRWCFGINWKRAEIAGPPLELLILLNKRFSIVSFELESESAD